MTFPSSRLFGKSQAAELVGKHSLQILQKNLLCYIQTGSNSASNQGRSLHLRCCGNRFKEIWLSGDGRSMSCKRIHYIQLYNTELSGLVILTRRHIFLFGLSEYIMHIMHIWTYLRYSMEYGFCFGTGETYFAVMFMKQMGLRTTCSGETWQDLSSTMWCSV